jgi:hypothetical protein
MISKNLHKDKKAVTFVFVLLLSVFGIQSSYADYYPTGIQENVSEQILIDNGWTLFYQETYAVPISALASEIKPSGQYVIITGKAVDTSTLLVLAAAPTSDVFTETEIDTPQLINGTYWYYTPNWSIGFAPTDEIFQIQADIVDLESPLRLSWHLYGDGGWRLGTVQFLNLSDEYLKQVWTWNGSGPTEEEIAAEAARVAAEAARVASEAARVASEAARVASVRAAQSAADAAYALKMAPKTDFGQCYLGSDKVADPTGEIRGMLDEINRKYGNLIK